MIFPLDNRYFITDFDVTEKKDEEESFKAEQELQQKRKTLSLDELFRIKDACNDVVNQVPKALSTAEYSGS